jgi:hypothetical protein
VISTAAPAYLEPHGTPSGGDWAVSRTAALFLQGIYLPIVLVFIFLPSAIILIFTSGTVDAVVANCTFSKLDGNAIFLSG